MINRGRLERYLVNRCGCRIGHGTDVTLVHGTHSATLGNHAITQVDAGRARRFLQDLGFSATEITNILNNV